MRTTTRYGLCFVLASVAAIFAFPMMATFSARTAPAWADATETLLRTFDQASSSGIRSDSVAVYGIPGYQPPSCKVLTPVEAQHSSDSHSPAQTIPMGELRSGVIRDAQTRVLA